MSKEKKIKVWGFVRDSFPNATFKVELSNGRMVLAYLCGKMRQKFIKVLPGDRVQLEISPYDPSRGRIIYRE